MHHLQIHSLETYGDKKDEDDDDDFLYQGRLTRLQQHQENETPLLKKGIPKTLAITFITLTLYL